MQKRTAVSLRGSRNHAVGHMTRAGRGHRVWFVGDRTNIHQAETMPPLPVSDWIRAAPKETPGASCCLMLTLLTVYLSSKGFLMDTRI